MRPAMLSILPHTHTFRCRRPVPASVYFASQPTVTTGTVNTARISYLGCALRTARLSGFPRTRPHPCVVAAHHILHARPPDATGCAICLAHPELASDLFTCLELRSSPSVRYCLEDPRHPYPLEQIFVVGWIGVSPSLLEPHAFGGLKHFRHLLRRTAHPEGTFSFCFLW